MTTPSLGLADCTDFSPQPLQRILGKPLADHTIAVDTHPRWGNHFDPAPTAAMRPRRAAALAEYAVWLAGRSDLLRVRAELHAHHLACACPLDHPCHRDVLLDLADPDIVAGRRYGRAVGLTVRRPWASLLLVPSALGGKNIENRPWTTSYRGPILIVAGTRIDAAGADAATLAGLDAAWHTRQQGWLGAAVLTDVHPARARCCQPWGHPPRRPHEVYHWVFAHPARLALPVYGTGFLGLRKVAWTNLIRAKALATNE